MNKKFIISYAILYATVFIDAFGSSMIVPILPQFSKHFGSSTIEHSITYAAYSFAQFISVIIMGKLSDIYGRKPLLIASLIGSSFGPIIQGFCNSTWTFVVARFFTGALGGSSTIGYAYIADTVLPKDRPKYQNQLSAMTCIAYCIGPVFGSMLISISLSFPLYLY